MDTKETKIKHFIVRIDNETKKKYQKYCIDKEINMSDRIRDLIQKDIEGKIK